MTTLPADLVDPADDLPHSPPDVAGWTENYQWCAADSSGLGVMAHVGTMPAQASLWHTVFGVTTPDGRVLVHKSVGPAPGERAAGTAIGSFRCEEAYQRWTCSFHGGMRVVDEAELTRGLLADGPNVPVTIELELRAAAPLWQPVGAEDHPEWGRFHHEQGLWVSGVVEIDGERLTLNGVGHRDHSAGVRDLSQIRRAMWVNGVFPSGWSFAAMWAVRTTGEQFQRGLVCRDGRGEDAVVETVSTIDDAWANPRQFDVVLTTPSGQRRVKGTVLSGANFSVAGEAEWCVGTDVLDPHSYVLTHRFARWECDGEVTYGFADRGARSDELHNNGGIEDGKRRAH